MNDKKQIYSQYFQENILPAIKPFEQERIKTVRKLIFTSVLFFMMGVLFACLFIFNALNNIFNPLLVPILLFFMYVFIIKSITGVISAGRDYRKKLVKEILPLFYVPVANFKDWPKNHDTESVINSKLFPNFDTQEDEKCVFGYYNGTNIIISDTRLTYPLKNAVKSYLFKGTTIQLELPKSINNHVILCSRNSFVRNNGYFRVVTKIKEFDDEAYIFAKNSKNLEFINEKLWSNVKRFAQLYTAKNFGFSYNNNVVLIAVSQRNPMEFGSLFSSLLKKENYDELIERFTVIYDLIDLLI